jgi:hypothetical protein
MTRKPSSSVWSENEVSVRIFIDLFDHKCVSERVLYVFARETVTCSSSTHQSYYETHRELSTGRLQSGVRATRSVTCCPVAE